MPSKTGAKATAEALRRGRAAYERSAWAEAYAAYGDVLDAPETMLQDLERFAIAADLIGEAELQCKTTGLPDQAICSRTLMAVANAARARRARA